MKTTDVIIKRAKQLEWEECRSLRIDEYRLQYHKNPTSIIVENNPHSFTHKELLELTKQQMIICSIVEKLALLK